MDRQPTRTASLISRLRRLLGSRNPGSKSRLDRRVRLTLEVLEDRLCPSSIQTDLDRR